MPAEFITDQCRQFATYWQSLPKDGAAPNRSAFLPEDIPQLLPMLSMLEPVSPHDMRVLFVGTLLASRYGKDISGENYLDYVEPSRREKSGEALYKMSLQPCGMQAIIRYSTKSGINRSIESVGFPMQRQKSNMFILFFINSIFEGEPNLLFNTDEIQEFGLQDRRFIDIGYGIPDDIT